MIAFIRTHFIFHSLFWSNYVRISSYTNRGVLNLHLRGSGSGDGQRPELPGPENRCGQKMVRV